MSGVAQVNKVENQTTADSGNRSLATNITKELVTKQCPLCSYFFKYSGNIGRHISIVHCDTTFKCDHCDKLCAGKNYLKRHMLNKHKDKKIICDQCTFECATGQILRRHNYD